MTLYAETGPMRVRQLLTDAVALLWIGAWLAAGRATYRTIDRLREATASAEAAGAGFAGRLEDAGRGIARLPVVGDDLRRPFNGAASAGRTLESAGVSAGQTVHTIALVAGIALALLPIAWVLARYVPARRRWIVDASAARRLLGNGEGVLHLFALRAAATAPLRDVLRAEPDPAGALARGDHRALAALELGRLGLRLPATS